ncbi:oligoendopeptidase O [Liquorilactobacillus capillatus DSM 19910]|uniref:Oligoendopeptidase O n=2 Tax=Liquorilactobacillus capillatus TaxID=480931 RepID=A0A0R1M174_9LACO|nr:oligoendopeptidase O [Liquorilactobacillus capillatus DSM 19910]
MAVNGEWLKTAKIPADKPLTGGFADLADNIEKLLMHDFKDLSEKDKDDPSVKDPYLYEFLKYYRLATNFSKRDAAGFKPARAYLKKVEDLKNLADWEKQLTELTLAGYASPVPLYVEPDMKNTQLYALYASVPNLILPDKTYYAPENKASAQLLQVYSDMLSKLMALAGYEADFIQQTLTGALAFDKSLVPHVKDSTELADYVKSYNKYSLTDFVNTSQHFNLRHYITTLIGQEPDQVIVSEPKYYAALNELVNEETFANMKSWLLVKTILSVSPYLSDQIRIIAGTYSRTISGSKEPMNTSKSAYYLATSQFDQVVGLYYAHKYFGETAKNDVTTMVKKMTAIYKKRLANNTWLSTATRQKAIIKLDKLGIQVGYPDKLDPLYKKFKVKSDSLLTNSLNFTHILLQDHYAKWNKQVDRTRWEMSAHTVNAYYNPSYNIIVFPAAILQAPFYSLRQTASENYGGIGAVIAHEISHAFDNNGAHFDELGNLHNWWTTADLEYFNKLSQKMITEFDGLKTPAGKVNGKLVVSENIADAGGLSCALEAATNEAKTDLKAFFYNWARVWCMKSSLERQKLLLAIDVHAPHELRANIQPQNLTAFYTTFDIKPQDGMYLEPSKRINIW